jgi:hypothetical protein
MKRIFRINTNLTEERDEEIDKSLDKSDREMINMVADDDEFSTFDIVDDEGYLVSYILGDQKQINVMVSMLKKYEVKHTVTDITEEFMMGRISIPTLDFREYYHNNLTKDLILDKINEYGKESLTSFELEFLKS